MKVSFRHLAYFLECDLLNSLDDSLSTFRKTSLSQSVFSKLITEKANDADEKALKKFLSANESCKNWTLKRETMVDDYLIGEVRNELHRFWLASATDGLASHPVDFLQFGKTGPGAAIGANGTDYYSKLYSSKLTVTSRSLYDMYRRHCSIGPFTNDAEKARISDYGTYSLVAGNRLYFVPKKNDISRTICVEPSLNLYFQMGFRHILEARLKQIYNIDLSSQPFKNRELARRGSIDSSIATIDLSSASDSISVKMLREVLPREWFSLLMCIRSPMVQLPCGRSEELHMISSMGNAFTFPLETIIFRAVLSAAARVDGSPIDSSNLAVFGDDIACPTFLVGKVLRLLELLGFTVNADKTFVEGPFRESCGHDYLSGHDVRPVFIKSLETQQDRYVAINLLNAWSAKCKIPLPLAVQYLLSTVEKCFVPPSENADAGILSPLMLMPEGRRKFDSNGSLKYRSYRAIPTVLRINFKKRRISGFKSSKLSWNPFGLLDSFLRGYIRDHLIPVRHNSVRYTAKWNVTPNWNYIPADSFLGIFLSRSEDVQRLWNSAVYLNFFR